MTPRLDAFERDLHRPPHPLVVMQHLHQQQIVTVAPSRLGMDPRILSHELAPTTWSGWWKQRTRWSQGWHEVTLRHSRSLLVNRRLSLVQKRGVVFLLVWRVVHPYLALQLRRRGIRVVAASLLQTLGSGLKTAVNEVMELDALFATFEVRGTREE